MAAAMNKKTSVSVAIVGSGGAGVITAGKLLLAAAARAGCYGLMTRSAGPQIRGGESVSLLRLSVRPVACLDDRIDLLLAIDWKNAERFKAEIPLAPESLIVSDRDGKVPEGLASSGARICKLAFAELAGSVPGGRANMVALGVLGALLSLPEDAVSKTLAHHLCQKGEEVIRTGRDAVSVGFSAAQKLTSETESLNMQQRTQRRWLISGNEAVGLGALRGGVRFGAAYPITPATEILEWLASKLPEVGGTLVQAEDELASINMLIGASYAGVPALTATSGPGLSLMMEGLGLAVNAEVPVVVINVMRGGPSTGIPAKSEQTDLNIAVYGCHGDAPHLVLAPNSVADCLFTTQWSVHLAEATQAPVVVLSDQFLGQSTAIIDPLGEIAFFARRQVALQPGENFERYALTADGISPMPLPGTAGGQYTAEGLEHDTRGIPSGRSEDHCAQMDKRARKIAAMDYTDHWADVEGDGSLAVITWGSTTTAVREALQRLSARGIDIRLIALRLLLPAQPQALAAALVGVERILVAEQSHSGQFYRFLRAHYDLPCHIETLHRPGPLIIRPGEIVEAIENWNSS